ncbi:hypothetical protein A3N53_12235 [Enterobacter hormaechei subsp. steigerwaltii]|nr:hypothetical protein A3N53_12235 [Enterobacter hormaechei subsp. steigerwaltii]
MHILPPVRPEKSIERLTAILEPIAEKVHVVPRKRLTWLRKGKQQMYLFLEGELSLRRLDHLCNTKQMRLVNGHYHQSIRSPQQGQLSVLKEVHLLFPLP